MLEIESIMKIIYEKGCVKFQTQTTEYFFSEIDELSLVQDQIRKYIANHNDEQIFHTLIGVLDLLVTAKNQLLKDHEQECLRNWLYIR